MSKRLTTEEFIQRSKNKFHDKFTIIRKAVLLLIDIQNK